MSFTKLPDTYWENFTYGIAKGMKPGIPPNIDSFKVRVNIKYETEK